MTSRRSALLLLLVLAACQHAASRASSAQPAEPISGGMDILERSAGAITCPGHPEIAFPRTLSVCTRSSDCEIAQHGLDRCGSYEAVGVNVRARAELEVAESACRRAIEFATGHCRTAPTAVQRGGFAPSSDAVAVRCVAGACTTSPR